MIKGLTQKRNPHGLTANQHLFAAASINRFSDVNGSVEVKRIGAKQSFLVKSDNKIFCANFVWDHGSESGFMKKIEDQYQALINDVLNDKVLQFSGVQNQIITKMYVLCCVRFIRKKTPIPSRKLNGVKPEILTIDEKEILEKKGYKFVDSNSIVSSRMLSGEQIQHEVDHIFRQWEAFNWGILSTTGGEFIIPDNFIKHRYLPLTPTMMLVANQVSRPLGIEEVEKINRDAIQSSDTYFFARNFSACPLLKPLFVFIQNELLKTKKTAHISVSGFFISVPTNPIK
jgi:hypothetical protein